MPTRDDRALDQVRHLDVALDRDGFMRTVLGHLSGTLEEVFGIHDAEGLVSVVGQRMGEDIDVAYRRAFGVQELSREQVAAAMVDLERRIQGDFFVIEQDDARIVLGNRACPFGENVAGRPSLCMMTSNVFGVIAAENLGYARVVLEETIAGGSARCRIVVHLTPRASVDGGHEYVRNR